MTILARKVEEARFDDRPVLATAALRPGFDRDNLSRVDDPSWDLSPALVRENARHCHLTVHFSTIEDPIESRILREYLYARLNIDLPATCRRIPPPGVRGQFNRTRRFLTFVRNDLGAINFAAIDQALLDRYAKMLTANGLRPNIVARLLEVVFTFYNLRTHLPTAGFSFEPWPGRTPSSVAGFRSVREENRTPRIPEPVLAPLLAWSLRYVEHFSADILAARIELTRLEIARDMLRREDGVLSVRERRKRHRERLIAFLEQRRCEGRGVPIWESAYNGTLRRDPRTGIVTSSINAHIIHLHIGIDAVAEPATHIMLTGGSKDLIDAAADEFGLEVGGMDTAVSALSDTGAPWRYRFDAKSLDREEQMLQSACYIVCAYLTGMRDSEVQAMRSGCMTVIRSEDGLVLRHRLKSVVYKGRGVGGEPADWITVAPVAAAVKVLETLSARAIAARGVDTLWPVLRLREGGNTHLAAEVVRQLNAFRDHLNHLFSTDSAPAVPAGPSGAPWRLTTRQLRRTLAWHIGNRPFGTIAGMLQYKHASVAAFEGYAGTSASGFRAEVEAECSLGQLDDVLDYFDSRRHGSVPSGPAGARVSATLDAAEAELGPAPAMIADRARERTMLASLARTLHVGVLADCFFDPAKALCLRNAGRPDQRTPLTTMCEPTRCPNACIVERHRPVWAGAAENARAMLREKRLSEPQRIALRQDLERIEAVIDGIGNATQEREQKQSY